MLTETFNFLSGDDTRVFVYNWKPEVKAKGIVQIAHGMAETAARYERFAEVLTKNGYSVYANDQRGHGKTAGSLEKVGVLAEKDGFDWMVRDMYQLTEIGKENDPGLPVFLFGHSMGSFASQRYLMLHGRGLEGVVLSGSNGPSALLQQLGLMIAASEVRRYGREAKSKRMNRLLFGNYNKNFRPNQTEFDWLSRDYMEVDKYLNDPYCGDVFSAGFFFDFMKGLKELGKKNNISDVPKNLPIYIFSGAQDPVGRKGKGIKKLYKIYKKQGIRDVTLKLYPEGRHEMLNEINRDEVMQDVVNWLDQVR